MESLQAGVVSAEFAALIAAVDSYLSAVQDGLLVRSSDADVVAEVGRFEVLRRRLDSSWPLNARYRRAIKAARISRPSKPARAQRIRHHRQRSIAGRGNY
jgi:hypothetical protein